MDQKLDWAANPIFFPLKSHLPLAQSERAKLHPQSLALQFSGAKLADKSLFTRCFPVGQRPSQRCPPLCLPGKVDYSCEPVSYAFSYISLFGLFFFSSVWLTDRPQAIVLMLEFAPQSTLPLLLPQLDNVINFMLTSTKSEHEEVALEACEFWLVMAESDLTRLALHPYLSSVSLGHSCWKILVF